MNRSYRIYLSSQFAAALLMDMVWTVNLVFQVQAAHLNPLQLVLVGTTLEATAFVFQVPTGIVADVYSRRGSVIVGYLLVGAGLGLSGLFPIFGTILIAQVISGIGYTFVDGALEAWVADELGDDKAGRAFLRASQFAALGGLAGIAISTVLAGWILNLPVVLGGAGLMLLSGVLFLRMPENNFRPVPRENRNSWQQMGHTLKQGLRLARVRPVVLTILAIAIVHGAFSEGFDRLWTPHLLNDFSLPALGPFPPVAWFGLLRAGATVLSLLPAEIIRRRIDTNSHTVVARALMAIEAGIMIAVLALASTQSLAVAFAALLAVGPLRDTADPLSAAWLNQSLEPQVRATLFSVRSQMDALGQVVGGPILGVIATTVSVRSGMSVSALLLVAVLALYALSLRRGEARVPEVAAAE